MTFTTLLGSKGHDAHCHNFFPLCHPFICGFQCACRDERRENSLDAHSCAVLLALLLPNEPDNELTCTSLLMNFFFFFPVGKKRQEQAADFEFLEKRMHHDLLMKEKECAMEARRLALEERRLAWEEERTRAELQLKEKEMEMKAQERTEERRMLAEQRAREQKERTEEHNKVLAQQQCLLSILERVLEKINK